MQSNVGKKFLPKTFFGEREIEREKARKKEKEK